MSFPSEKICVVCRREFPGEIDECPDDRVQLTEKDARIGTIFDGKYEILDFIGAGGLSRVYKARHIELHRIMALKILKSSELIDLQRFRREAISIGQLDHPNIARVYSFAVAENRYPYMALEFLDGKDLAECLARDGPLDAFKAVNIFEQVANALEHAHSRNIIHRDIKPGNIILPSGPESADCVKVVDFGMARIRLEGSKQKITQEGEIFGTRHYISPEQYKGVVADERADIYALGVSMYESVLKDGKVPEALCKLIKKSTETDPAARYQTAAQLKEELAGLRETLSGTVPGSYVAVNTVPRRKASIFETFYFWSMLTGMIVLGICAVIVVKQKLAALDVVAPHAHSSSLSRVGALSLAATQNQARGLLALGQIKEAIKLYEEWLKRNHSSQKFSAQLAAERELASLHSLMGDDESAIKCAEAGLAIADRHGIKSGYEYIDLLTTTAAITRQRKDYKKSIELSTQALELTQEMEFSHEIEANIVSLANIATCRRDLGELDNAEEIARQALDLSERFSGRSSLVYGDNCSLLATIFEKRKDYERALEYVDSTILCLKKAGPYSNGDVLNETARKAELEIKMKNRPAAERDYKYVAEQLAKPRNDLPQISTQIKAHMRHLAAFLGKSDDLGKWCDETK